MERVMTDPKGDQRLRVLAILRQRSNPKGYVKDVDVPLIARMTGIAEHDVAKQLWGLQKQGVVGFSTKRIHGKTVPYRFRIIRKSGEAVVMRAASPETADLLDAMAQEPVPEPTERPREAREPRPGTETPKPTETPKEAVPWDGYPEIAAVMARRDQITKAATAAAALEEAGLHDLAEMAIEAVPALSGLEAEIVRYIDNAR